ncbi:MAG: phosphate/phosphite/phosphonate ABC transporter substrate-binding protein [Gammaproteobacteria bacterium]|nr:phosphate/phosphite/phosphonate ABC transporter substrate-binding protein [Gammaproteobacteria bacterium]MDH5631171.1 phosphate/phosphite/phosphonate ABC transporter substrate-binding protein [Gammaproteobacteria bacterium]
MTSYINWQFFIKKLLALVFISLLSSYSSHSPAKEKHVFTVGVVPQFETKKLHRIWRPILDKLEQKTGYKFKLLGSPSISGFEKEFLVGKFDFAYMNPYHLAWSHKTIGYVPLVRDIKRSLYGVLVVRKDSPIKTPFELDGKKVAFPDPNALGASLLIRAELKKKFNITIIPHYVKTHDSVYLNVALRQADAGGGVQKTLDMQSDKIKNHLRIMYETEKVAAHPFSVHPRIDKIIHEKVRQALIEIGQEEEGKQLLKLVPIMEIGSASIEDYLSLTNKGLEKFRSE